MARSNLQRWRAFCLPHGLAYTCLSIVVLSLLILTIIFANARSRSWTATTAPTVRNEIIGFPLHLSKNEQYVQWTFLHLNDVYELLPLDNGRKGGLARVAYIRQLLKEENSHTYTILAGDLLSPSALSASKVNGTRLSGKQMIATMNTLGLDLMTFGNHEFDLDENELLERMSESTFTWISSNVLRKDSNQLFGTSILHRIISIGRVRILFIGLTTDANQPYVRITNRSSLIPFVQNYLQQFSSAFYDVLVAITHLDLSLDIKLAEQVPQIDLILGGHEHENYYFLRGGQHTPIYKADANAATVYILRCAYNMNTDRLRVYPTLSPVTSEVPEDEATARVANQWFNLGIEGFRALGFEPHEVVACLPSGVELDGRSESIRFFSTLLTDAICESMVHATQPSRTRIGLFKTGALRLDDILRDTITQYDILRTLPFTNYVVSLSVPGVRLARILSENASSRRKGSLLVYVGVETLNNGESWLVDGIDIATSGQSYTVATTDYTQRRLQLNTSDTILLRESNVTLAKSLMEYLRVKYPAC